MPRFSLLLECNSPPFNQQTPGGWKAEVQAILLRESVAIETTRTPKGIVTDTNGTVVGSWTYEP